MPLTGESPHSATESSPDLDLDALYAAPPPWDLGRPQPALVAAAEAGALRGRVLDVGCGTGEHALMAAARGHEAVGVDLAGAALEQGRRKARDRGLRVRFLQHDALALGELGEHFDTVLDCLVFHGFHGTRRAAYVASLGAVLPPGGRYLMLCHRDEPPNRSGRVHRVTPEEIRAAFADGWQVDAIDPATAESTLPTLADGLRGWRARVTRI